ncbi:amidohydrolase family protein [Jeotgalibaca sp. MA1X17-3]|uniref:adenine deaminase C-terminal domain-containing protein n=1 Tax=Jeotgalibaca sp. MA1X17-3 TaxID=2908211 RepID=UPI001F355DEF|nr:adenine deaminase C-terminal domain-containing protein [Jeotgalibaca sp. MA1X17-3]UJF15835.1 amidohydrolase family protein [Jeotgalibaca sp. MA1X17-3]
MKIDLLLENAFVFNVFRKTFEKKNIAIANEKFYYVSEASLRELEPTEILDVEGKFIVPGFIDIHMHIESSMIPPSIFSGVALSYGITTVVADSHEIANVFGQAGIEAFMQEKTDLDIFYAIPSSVPSTTPELETTGGLIGLNEVASLLEHPKVIALGEAMNFKGITDEPNSLIRQILKKVQELKPLMPLEGHIPRVSGETLAKFMHAGLTADHTQQTPESILEKVSSGVFLELQKKSITPENIQTVVDYDLYEHIAIITDDIMADDLLKGHLDENVRLAVACGMPVEEAIYTTTYTPARRMGLQDRGAIASGFLADFIILDDLETIGIDSVYKKGRCVHQREDKIVYPLTKPKFPDYFYDSIHCKPLTNKDLEIHVDGNQDSVTCNVIQIQEIGTFTEHVQREIPVINGILDWENSGLSLIMVMERYGKNGNIGYGLIEHSLKEKGAVATTWAHDHHNLMVMGTSIEDILLAQHKILDLKGGYVVSKNGELSASCPLPIGGILSDENVYTLGNQLKNVRQAMVDLGYRNTNEIMSFSTLSLPVSPQLKITDFGMMDVHTHALVPLIEGKE